MVVEVLLALRVLVHRVVVVVLDFIINLLLNLFLNLIQWVALARKLLGLRTSWRGRSLAPQ